MHLPSLQMQKLVYGKRYFYTGAIISYLSRSRVYASRHIHNFNSMYTMQRLLCFIYSNLSCILPSLIRTADYFDYLCNMMSHDELMHCICYKTCDKILTKQGIPKREKDTTNNIQSESNN